MPNMKRVAHMINAHATISLMKKGDLFILLYLDIRGAWPSPFSESITSATGDEVSLGEYWKATVDVLESKLIVSNTG
jgi:hypothetical protein